MEIRIPAQVKKALDLLPDKGYEAYLVGGCVRDCLMGKEPGDWDITTQAKPQETAEVFSDYRVIETGIKHGTLTVLIDRMPIEITTYRIDGEYSDGRRPDSVTFTRDLIADLSRRDFTVNALAYSPKEGLIDAFGGLEDLEKKIIRCVGEPDLRFKEDALRILRALRFASVLGFDIEKNTAQSLLKNRALLDKISAERIQHELMKLLAGQDVERILLDFRPVIFRLIPELEPTDGFDRQDGNKHAGTVYEHTAHMVSLVKNEPRLRLAMLLHNLGQPSGFSDRAAADAEQASEILSRLKFGKRFSQEVVTLVRYFDLKIYEEPESLPLWLGKLGESFIRGYLQMKKADLLAQAPETAQKAVILDELEVRLNELLEEGACLSLKDLKINGNDIVGLGAPKTDLVGEMLDILFELVLKGELKNERADLLIKAEELLKDRP